jgi:hypothetical protein
MEYRGTVMRFPECFPFFWNMTPRDWVTGPRRFETAWLLRLQRSAVQYPLQVRRDNFQKAVSCSEAYQASYCGNWWQSSPPEVSWPGHAVEHSPSSTKVENAWCYDYIPKCTFTVHTGENLPFICERDVVFYWYTDYSRCWKSRNRSSIPGGQYIFLFSRPSSTVLEPIHRLI